MKSQEENKRYLRNYLRGNLTLSFRGRDRNFKSKSVRAFNMNDEEESAEYFQWLKIYGGLIVDDTTNVLEKVGGNK